MRISAYKRLMDLPEAFTTKTLAANLGGDTKLASVYLFRWRKEGLISSIGPRAGLHFNLVRNPNAAQDLRMEAIAFLFPGAMISGVSAVHAAGWTTQIPRSLEIAVPMRRSFPEIDDCAISSRPRSWFRLAKQNVSRHGPVPTLDPAFALADLCHSGEWRPDADDIEWDLVDAPALTAAFEAFDLDLPEDWHAEMSENQIYFGV